MEHVIRDDGKTSRDIVLREDTLNAVDYPYIIRKGHGLEDELDCELGECEKEVACYETRENQAKALVDGRM